MALLYVKWIEVHVKATNKFCGETHMEADVIFSSRVNVIVDKLLEWGCGKATLAFNSHQGLGVHLQEHLVNYIYLHL